MLIAVCKKSSINKELAHKGKGHVLPEETQTY